MKFGVGLPNYGRGKTFADIKRVALAAEELGYDSVWTTDHIIVPKADIEPYGNILESLTVLAMVAAVTTRVKLGTSILVLPQRNATLTAKQVATIDAASGGRMIFGVGVGWNAGEYANLNAPFKTRGKRLDEDIELLRTLWSHEDVSFRGHFTNLEHAIFAPQPAQKNIPIWIGGNDEPALHRVAKHGDGWHPTGISPEGLQTGVKHIRELNATKNIVVSARLSTDLRADASPTYQYRGNARYRLAGNLSTVRARLREYHKAGLEYPAVFFPMDDLALGLAQMETFTREVMPEFE
jgi:probable F420-dependent oxidoreductase